MTYFPLADRQASPENAVVAWAAHGLYHTFEID
jgi:hypothetical protein